MYILKPKFRNKETEKNFNELLKLNDKKQKDIADIIGVDRTYISQVANGKGISKLCAYAVCKAINSELELIDLFKQKKCK